MYHYLPYLGFASYTAEKVKGVPWYILYIGTLLVTLSNDVQLNPGPRPPKYPCGSCGAAVRNNQNSIQCDGCNFWFHISCQGMNTSIHHIMAEHASYSWSCLNCGLLNFSTAIYDDFSISDCSTNNFSVLDSSLPPRTSTPIKKKTFSKNSNKLKVININFRSVVNKVHELQCLIDTENPDVVIGTESWLSPEISRVKFFLLATLHTGRTEFLKPAVAAFSFWSEIA